MEKTFFPSEYEPKIEHADPERADARSCPLSCLRKRGTLFSGCPAVGRCLTERHAENVASRSSPFLTEQVALPSPTFTLFGETTKLFPTDSSCYVHVTCT